MVSIFIASTHLIPWISLVRFSRTSGVLPIRSSTLSAMAVPCKRASAESSPQGMRASVPLGLVTSIPLDQARSAKTAALMRRCVWVGRWS